MTSASVVSEFENRNAELPSGVISHRLGSVEDLEAAYENWIRAYIDQVSVRDLGVYSARGGALTVRLDDKGTKTSNRVQRILKYFTFFPKTEVPARSWCASDSEALLNDWVMVGSDLYGAIQQHKIESPHVRADNGTSRNAFSAAW